MARRAALIVASMIVSMACASERIPKLDGPWQPIPIALPGSLVEAVDRTCRDSMEEFPPEAELVVIDARGSGTIYAQYAATPNRVEASCDGMTIDARGQVVGGGGATGSGEGKWAVLQAHELEQIGGRGSRESTSTAGRVGPGIAGVLIVLPGLPPITASLANGWYLAWWPGEWPVGTKVRGLDTFGQTVIEAPIDAAPPAAGRGVHDPSALA